MSALQNQVEDSMQAIQADYFTWKKEFQKNLSIDELNYYSHKKSFKHLFDEVNQTNVYF